MSKAKKAVEDAAENKETPMPQTAKAAQALVLFPAKSTIEASLGKEAASDAAKKHASLLADCKELVEGTPSMKPVCPIAWSDDDGISHDCCVVSFTGRVARNRFVKASNAIGVCAIKFSDKDDIEKVLNSVGLELAK